jgi:hypothetical protein
MRHPQDYHGFTWVGHPKLLTDRVPCNPDDTVLTVDDQGHPIALGTTDPAVDKEILQLLASVQAERTKHVPVMPVSHHQSA